MQKITYLLSNINKSLQFEWIHDGLNAELFEQVYILLNNEVTDFEKFLRKKKTKVYRLNLKNKKSYLPLFFQISKILLREKPTIIHTHLFRASLIGMVSAKMIGIKKRITTRHHASYHREYYSHAVKYDRIINFLSTHIIAVSENVKNELITHEHVAPEKITVIHHGLNFKTISAISNGDACVLRKKYHLPEKALIVGVISRYIHLKGIQYIIPAFKKLLSAHPNSVLILANAKGGYSMEIKELLIQLPFNNYVEIEFEENLFALYALFDVFVHVPINKECEAFGQIYTEALAVGIPSVFTLSGVATEFIKDHKNAIVVPYKNTEKIYEAINELVSNNKLKEQLIQQGKKDVSALFNIEKTVHDLESLYMS